MSKRLLDQRWPWLLAAAVIVVAFLSTVVDVNFGPVDPRTQGSAEDILRLRDRKDLNVLFILIDTLRAEHLGSYGYERDTSPQLDLLASKGVRFARQLSQASWTKVSMASLWTGMYPARNGVTRFDDVISDEAKLPAEILSEAGFTTAAVYRNGWVAPNFGFSQGFDTYIRPSSTALPPKVRRENPTLKSHGTDQDATTAGLEFLRVHGHERWFLYLHLMDLHEYLYNEETALFGSSYADIYDNSIRWTDAVVGDFLQTLVDQGYADNTLVVISSDHGEAFRERGTEGHARTVYRETTEVPWFISFPFKLEPGVVVDARTRNVDVWPTILDLLGLEAPDGIDGRSAVPQILAAARGEATPSEPERIGLAHLDQHWGQRGQPPWPTVAVCDGSFRYVRELTAEGEPHEHLFDAASDPRELDDRSADADEAETVARLRGIADDYLESTPPWGAAPKREIEEMELNQLRALGYAIP